MRKKDAHKEPPPQAIDLGIAQIPTMDEIGNFLGDVQMEGQYGGKVFAGNFRPDTMGS